jgi:hypothetical protein
VQELHRPPLARRADRGVHRAYAPHSEERSELPPASNDGSDAPAHFLEGHIGHGLTSFMGFMGFMGRNRHGKGDEVDNAHYRCSPDIGHSNSLFSNYGFVRPASHRVDETTPPNRFFADTRSPFSLCGAASKLHDAIETRIK